MTRDRGISSWHSKAWLKNHQTKLDSDGAVWLDALAPWTHAVTLTCKRLSHRNRPITDHVIPSTARHVVQRLNIKCFGKNARKGASVAVVATYGWGVYDLHPHLHFCFECPPHLSYEAFSALIEEAANETYWIDRQRCTKPYLDEGWASYLIRHGTDQLIVDLIVPSASCAD
jgi:hypothetical protein